MALKPTGKAQLTAQTGLGRQGGISSKMSKPPVMKGTPGAGFAAMENALLKGPKPDPAAMSGGGAGRQFFTKAAGGDVSGLAKMPKAYNYNRSTPGTKAGLTKNNPAPTANIFGTREK